jgi:hypothetical protein
MFLFPRDVTWDEQRLISRWVGLRSPARSREVEENQPVISQSSVPPGAPPASQPADEETPRASLYRRDEACSVHHRLMETIVISGKTRGNASRISSPRLPYPRRVRDQQLWNFGSPVCFPHVACYVDRIVSSPSSAHR